MKVEYLTLAILVLPTLLSWPRLPEQLLLNMAARNTVAALANHHRLPEADTALARLPAEHCRANRLRGFVAQALGDEAGRDASWARNIRCDPGFIASFQVLARDNQTLAEWAVTAQPNTAEAWFWVAQVRARERPGEAIDLYRTGLRLNPRDGQRWQELGNLLVHDDPQAALAAYLESCRNGDPGHNGCLRAGAIAEQMGDVAAAIRFYRLSRWAGALDRAAQLERQQDRAVPAR